MCVSYMCAYLFPSPWKGGASENAICVFDGALVSLLCPSSPWQASNMSYLGNQILHFGPARPLQKCKLLTQTCLNP